MKIIDNYLGIEDFKTIKRHIESHTTFDWYLSPQANEWGTDERAYQFMHNMVWAGKVKYEAVNLHLKILLRPLKKKLKVHRAKVNLFVNQSEPIKMGFHTDFDIPSMKTLLFYLQDSNGYTEFENGEKVESKENRALIFSSNIKHQTVSQTDTLFRTNINLNYEEIE
tara:strand:- start:71 stop:571 length:501 start_codon:yes stop_codon:yes gene_type:complete